MIELRLPPDLAEFRAEVRQFLAEEMAPEKVAGHADPTDLTGLDLAFETAHQRRAGARGFLGVSVPTDLGGGGRPPSWKAVYSFEAAYHDAPSIDTALTLCGAPLISHATREQQARYLPAMLRGEVLWCVAYTEPRAGSDLGAVAATAEPHGAGFVLSGTKALVTGGHKASYALTIARTAPGAPAREALSMFVVDLSARGVQVRRRPTANGWTLSEIGFHDVVLDGDALVGRLHGGWRQMAAALLEERSGMAHLGWATRILESLGAWATSSGRPGALATLAPFVADLAAGYRLAEAVLVEADAGRAAPATAAMAKVWSTELLQRLARCAVELLGVEGLVYRPLFSADPAPGVPLGGRVAYEYLERIHPTISIGANELQRDAIARLALGLGGRP